MIRKLALEYVPGLAGGAVAGYLGYRVVAYLISHHGWWVPILPGAFAGLACGQLSGVASKGRGAINGLLGLGLAVYAQWRLFNPPFEFDKTFPSYLTHIHQLPPITLVILVVNGLLAFWWGRERRIGSIRDVVGSNRGG